MLSRDELKEDSGLKVVLRPASKKKSCVKKREKNEEHCSDSDNEGTDWRKGKGGDNQACL